MSDIRQIKAIFTGRPTLEGAGVKLHRVFGFAEVPSFDPFLMLDDFGSADPEDYTAGFPWHPHRGIETVTYMMHGEVRHGDSLGNAGSITDGQVQWMTAGSGIIHQEMPQRQDDYLRGFQLWVNLPAKDKMMDPRYQDLRAKDIPQIGIFGGPLGPVPPALRASGGPLGPVPPALRASGGASIRVVAGRYGDCRGPVKDIVCDPLYLDVRVPADGMFSHDVPADHTAFVYAYDGRGTFDAQKKALTAGHLGLYGPGTGIEVKAGGDGVRFLLIAGKPIGEPVAWRGPIVMNTEEELDRAFREYRNGNFIRHENRAR